MSFNLLYRVKRFFHGESGIVLDVKPLDETDEFHPKDYFGNLPQLVTFRNPLREVISTTARMEVSRIAQWNGWAHLYRQYQIGNNFP